MDKTITLPLAHVCGVIISAALLYVMTQHSICIPLHKREIVHTQCARVWSIEHISSKHCVHDVACYSLATYFCTDNILYGSDPFLHWVWACTVIMHNWLAWVGVVDRRVVLMILIKWLKAKIRRSFTICDVLIGHSLQDQDLVIFIVNNNDRRIDQSLYPYACARSPRH